MTNSSLLLIKKSFHQMLVVHAFHGVDFEFLMLFLGIAMIFLFSPFYKVLGVSW